MGIYVNPGNDAYSEAVGSMIYVDKSGLIAYTNSAVKTNRKFLCVSRPRRFGKSMAADMLSAYYSRGCSSEKLFEGREISRDASYLLHLNRHNVIRFDVQQFLTCNEEVYTFLDDLRDALVDEMLIEFPGCPGLYAGSKLQTAINAVYSFTGRGFVFIIDEWDCVFRMAREQEEIQKRYLNFLRGLFKGAVYVELAYMTGILPIKKYGEQSAINMFDEYSMTDPKNIGEYFGFTEEEVCCLCGRYGVEFTEVQKWYDGYLVGDNYIYNPKSVVDVLTWKNYQSYWTGTETYEVLKVYIERDFDGLKEAVIKMLGGGRCPVNVRKFQNDMTSFKSKDDILTLLIHLGYLTYDRTAGEAFIPNKEVAQEFMDAVDEPAWGGLSAALEKSERLLESTWSMDQDAVAKGLDLIHGETVSILKYNDENSLACVIYIAYYSAGAYYTKPLSELPSGKGFADIVYIPRRNVDKPAMVVELKWNETAKGAIDQIKERRYTQWVESYTGDILLVGINYDKSSKKHQCVIAKFKAGGINM